MDLFFTGNLLPIGNGFYKNIDDKYKLILHGKGMLKNYEASNVTAYEDDIKENDLKRLFQSYDFQSVIYFSMVLDGAIWMFNELEKLESTLYYCEKNNVKDFIYITTNEFQEGGHKNNENTSRYIFMEACEKICRNFLSEHEMNITVIKVPYLYSSRRYDNRLGGWIKSFLEEKEVTFPGTPDCTVDFLFDEDLAKLISRILDEPYRGLLEMNVSGGNRINFQTLGDIIADDKTDILIKYKDENVAIPQYHKGIEAREIYGWFPLSSLEDDIRLLISNYVSTNHKKRRFDLRAFWSAFRRDGLGTVVEMAILFAVALLLDGAISDNSQLRFLDFRLIFVVMIGTIRGLTPGVIAAVLASIGYFFSDATLQHWQIIFYNIQNWLPYGAYFMIGAVAGYTSDKKRDTIEFLNAEQKILENKFVFLNELYVKTLENKNAINNQIINYKDSYGRIYSVVQKLESTLPEHIFFEAINVLEDILDNRFVAIYSVANQDFARLVVCSKSLNVALNKSLQISDFPEMMTVLVEGKTWINLECRPNHPAYATGIFKEGRITGMIFIMQASNKHLNLEFSNKFNIISGLIKGALIRAIDRMELVEKDSMLPGTKILKKEVFAQILEVKRQMKEKEFSEYVLLKLKNTMSTLSELSEAMAKIVRNSDVIGEGEDNNIYLLLSQTNISNFSIVAKRLENNGILYELIQ
jgi:nucleoside-diphosphate-sugar epimerase